MWFELCLFLCYTLYLIPLPDGKAITVNDTINDPISVAIKERLSKAVKLLLEKPGIKVNELIEKLGVSERTTKRDLYRPAIAIHICK